MTGFGSTDYAITSGSPNNAEITYTFSNAALNDLSSLELRVYYWDSSGGLPKFGGLGIDADDASLEGGATSRGESVLLFGSTVYVENTNSVANAAILSITSVSDSILELLVSSDNPSICYPKCKTNLVTDVIWSSVGHSDNSGGPFSVNNLTHSSASGTNFVIYVEADGTKKFFEIGAE